MLRKINPLKRKCTIMSQLRSAFKKSKNYIFIALFTCLSMQSSSASLTNTDIIEFYNEQWNQDYNYSVYEMYNGNPNAKLSDLQDHLLPMTPLGCAWHRDGNVLKLKEHRSFVGILPEVQIHTFSGLSEYPIGRNIQTVQRFAYLNIHNGVTMQGYTNCEPASFARHPRVGDLRNYYPVTQKDFQNGAVEYWRGHVLDFATTICNEHHDPYYFYVSTASKYNFVTEPAGSWAHTIATQRVNKLKAAFGGYSRIFVYPYKQTKVKCGVCNSPRCTLVRVWKE